MELLAEHLTGKEKTDEELEEACAHLPYGTGAAFWTGLDHRHGAGTGTGAGSYGRTE